jgi:hypothetical protein
MKGMIIMSNYWKHLIERPAIYGIIIPFALSIIVSFFICGFSFNTLMTAFMIYLVYFLCVIFWLSGDD